MARVAVLARCSTLIGWLSITSGAIVILGLLVDLGNHGISDRRWLEVTT